MIRLPHIIFLPSPKLAVGAHTPATRARVDQCVADEVTQIRGQVITCRVSHPRSLRRTRQCHKQPEEKGLEHEAGTNVGCSSGLRLAAPLKLEEAKL